MWASIDKLLCDLVDRLRAMGHCYTLEAELHSHSDQFESGANRLDCILPGFREKGVVTITRVIHHDWFYS